jgi:hypothetical protein
MPPRGRTAAVRTTADHAAETATTPPVHPTARVPAATNDRAAMPPRGRTGAEAAARRVAGPLGVLGALPCALLAAGALVLASGAPAHAAGYRYWSYWMRSGGSWTYAQTGPAMHTPADGSVEGWRFAVSADAAAKAVEPRGEADFGAICGGTPAVAGRKRVALLIDPGTAADAPRRGTVPPPARTACAQVPTGASSADALAAVAKPLRYNSIGMVCAIAGYPQAGCGEQVSGAGPASSAAGGSGSGPSVGLIAGGAAVAVLGGAAVWQSRRRARR